MKKRMVSILTALCLIGLAGCAGEEKNVGTKETADTPALVSEDLNPGNGYVLATEKGYYYYDDRNHGFLYFDSVTGKDMFLCNKPECRHDGSEFCVATNKKYTIDRYGLYSERLYAVAMEETDTQYLYHLISVALDGSELNEVVTYLTLEKKGAVPSMMLEERELYLHRNVAMLPLLLTGDDGTEFHGTAVVNLETKEVTFLDEESVSTDNIERTNITAHGDYFYYCRKEGKKTVLHRYNITDGTDETHKLLVGFQGNYVVQDDNTIVYTKSDNRILCVYHRETGENEEKVPLKRLKPAYNPSLDVFWEEEQVYEALELKTDGTYIYVKEPAACSNRGGVPTVGAEVWDESYIHVFDRELKEIAAVNMAEAMAFAKEAGTEPPEDIYLQVIRCLYYEDDAVYVVSPNAGDYSKSCVYGCAKEEFLTGNPKFELVLKRAR